MTFDAWEWTGVKPDESRVWYRHCYGVRCEVWAVAGHFERTYFLDPIHLSEGLEKHLPATVRAITEVITAELTAAIKEPHPQRKAQP